MTSTVLLMNDKNKRIITRLVAEGKIPSEGLFDVTENHLVEYMEMYDALFGISGKKHKTPSNLKLARKIAGLTFMQLKAERGGTPSTCREGFVYLIENPAWPDHIKIGMAVDINKRLATYQTSDPYRQYRIKHYEFVLNRRSVEKQILSQYSVNIEQGEWIKNVNALEIVSNLAETYSDSKKIIKRLDVPVKKHTIEHTRKSRIVRSGTISGLLK